MLVSVYRETFSINVNIASCLNNDDSYHFPEKLIPLMVINSI